jgi:hypothetical protein
MLKNFDLVKKYVGGFALLLEGRRNNKAITFDKIKQVYNFFQG